MQKKLIKDLIIFLILLLSMSGMLAGNVCAESSDYTAVVYFTGIGCPHCANVDPILLKDLLQEYPDLVVVEYEIYQQSENASLIDDYNNNYSSGFNIPLLVVDKDTHISGDKDILDNFEDVYQMHVSNDIPLHDGTSVDIYNINQLPLTPKIWSKDRIAIKTGNIEISDILIPQFILGTDIQTLFKNKNVNHVTPQTVGLSGSEIGFDNAVEVDGWLLQWNGESVEGITDSDLNEFMEGENSSTYTGENISIGKTISLAAVDAVNPCALAVLSMMLIAIISYNPKNKKNVILAGLAFSLAVFMMYMFYGLVIIKFFQLVQAITSIRLILYKILGGVAIILGILQIRDFIKYKPGGLGTEMPLALRPKVKKIIEGVTSPRGAFGIGLFVTLFLLPCTIGPYVILGGMLSFAEIIQTIPHLVLYNIIFVLPMILITIVVYMGIKKVEDVSEWKDKNIKMLHLISGVIILILGVAMILGWT